MFDMISTAGVLACIECRSGSVSARAQERFPPITNNSSSTVRRIFGHSVNAQRDSACPVRGNASAASCPTLFRIVGSKPNLHMRKRCRACPRAAAMCTGVEPRWSIALTFTGCLPQLCDHVFGSVKHFLQQSRPGILCRTCIRHSSNT